VGLYDTIMGRGSQPAAPGTGAVTDPLDLPATYELPTMSPELYAQMFQPSGAPSVSTSGTAVPSYGAESRGAAMHQEDVTAVGGQAGKIVRAAKSLLGTPYVWGGSSTTGVDCSGLVQLAYKAAGVNLPRVSYQQAGSGKRVGLGDLKPGDLVAWDNSTRNNGADHIAIYLGGGQIIEAARPGTNVRIRKLGNNEGAWGVRILGGNRA
jgi:cell wall-associated NlpC family hydrolase